MEYLIECKSREQRKLIAIVLPKLFKLLKLGRFKNQMLHIVVDSDPDYEMCGTALNFGFIQFVAIKAGQDYYEMVTSLCHEMVHVKQCLTGKLVDTDKGRFWNGKKIPKKMHYLDQPHEKQAFMLESWLARKVMET